MTYARGAQYKHRVFVEDKDGGKMSGVPDGSRATAVDLATKPFVYLDGL